MCLACAGFVRQGHSRGPSHSCFVSLPQPNGSSASCSVLSIYLTSLHLSHFHCIFCLPSPHLHILLCHKQGSKGTPQDLHTFLAADLVLHSNMKNKIPSGKDVLHNKDCEVVPSWSELHDVRIASDVVAKKKWARQMLLYNILFKC